MLRTQRLLAFSSRVHTYLLLLLCFFFVAYLGGSYFQVDESYIDLLVLCHELVGWTIYLMGIWIIVLGLIVAVLSGIFPLKLILLNLLRVGIAFFISYAISFAQHLLHEGLVIGW